MAENWLIFVDTNIMLDFYRMPGENAGRQIDSLKKHLNSIIVTEQVKMEFMKHRQKVVSDMMGQMSAPQKAALPMILTGSRAGKALSKAMEQAVKRHKEAKERVELILAEPGRFDPVYRGLSSIFSHNGRLNLKRPNKQRYEIRKLADERFRLGYPPRKSGDTSIGDALNWEWIIRCAQTTENSNILVVSRDGDYGITQGNKVTLNDWLKAEFKARVRKRKIELTNKLTVALRKLAEAVAPEDEAAETSVIAEAPSPIDNYLRLPIRETMTPEELRRLFKLLRGLEVSPRPGNL